MDKLITELASMRALRIALVTVFALLALFLLVKTWGDAFGTSRDYPNKTITVEGTGEATAIPDTARISFTVTESAPAVADAQKKATEKTDAAIAGVKELGIEEEDVKTLSYNVSPKYEYPQPCAYGMCPPTVSGAPRIVGYDVSQSIEVRVRDTAKAGDVLQALGTLGVQNIFGPDFVVDDREVVKSEARAEAIERAEAKAKVLAKELGVRLGKVVGFYENSPSEPMYEGYAGKGGMMDAAVQSAPTLPVGQDETSITVSITYQIK